ncbi:MAG TPA: hypothetical protein PKC28_10075 [Bdellovibrionales bacterium]|nr:hypothetical protein [Bdellovibrionales bacterium]
MPIECGSAHRTGHISLAFGEAKRELPREDTHIAIAMRHYPRGVKELSDEFRSDLAPIALYHLKRFARRPHRRSL